MVNSYIPRAKIQGYMNEILNIVKPKTLHLQEKEISFKRFGKYCNDTWQFASLFEFSKYKLMKLCVSMK